MKILKKVFSGILVFVAIQGYTQDENESRRTKNGMMIQYNGEGAFSFRYEYAVFSKEKISMRPYLGLSHTEPNYNSLGFKWYGIPAGLNLLLGKRKSHFEAGIGYWWLKSYHQNISSATRVENVYQLNLGYRFQDLTKPELIARIGVAPSISSSFDVDYKTTDSYISFYVGIGMGF